MAVSEKDVRHFLGRIGFAPDDMDVAHFVGREIPDIVAEVLDLEPNLPGRPSYIGADSDFMANAKTVDWWLNRMRLSRWTNRQVSTPSPLLEKLTLFWHGHFATAFKKVEDANLMWEQNQIFRRLALGDFWELCQDVSLHGAMMIYLDNDTNVAGAVQENFARELMELFTMGIGNYTEADVVAMARAWTGHGIVGYVRELGTVDKTYEFHEDRHDFAQKVIFGIEADWDGPATITELVRNSKAVPTARFLSTKLWRFFVHGNPTPAVIDELADAFVSSGQNIKELMRALLSHDQFWAGSTRSAIVKTPTQYVVDFARKTNIVFEDEDMRREMAPMGQVLFEPPNVAGWGTNGYWLSTATMWGRSRFVTNRRWNLADGGFLSGLAAMSSDAGTDHLLRRFGIDDPSVATRDAVHDWFETTVANSDFALVPVGMSLVTMLPEFQVI